MMQLAITTIIPKVKEILGDTFTLYSYGIPSNCCIHYMQGCPLYTTYPADVVAFQVVAEGSQNVNFLIGFYWYFIKNYVHGCMDVA